MKTTVPQRVHLRLQRIDSALSRGVDVAVHEFVRWLDFLWRGVPRFSDILRVPIRTLCEVTLLPNRRLGNLCGSADGLLRGLRSYRAPIRWEFSSGSRSLTPTTRWGSPVYFVIPGIDGI